MVNIEKRKQFFQKDFPIFLEEIKRMDIRSYRFLMENYPSIKSLTESLNPFKSCYISGKVGVGKTVLSLVLMLDHIEKTYLSGATPFPNQYQFIKMEDLLNEIKMGIPKDQDLTILQKYIKYKVLIIDEILTLRLSEFEYRVFNHIVSKRYDLEKITYYTCNLSLTELMKVFNDVRSVDRIKSDCKGNSIELQGQSKR